MFSFVDLFAGIGGMRLAFENAGGKCVFSSEWDKYPAKVYEDNFGELPHGDITKIEAKDIPSHDILVAGFPCQPFSQAGSKKGFKDKTRGGAFFDIVRILKHHKPRMFLLENVKGLCTNDKGKTLKKILKVLVDLDYKISYKVIDGGLVVPQHRERLYIVGHKNKKFEFPYIEKKETSLADILEDKVDAKYTLRDGTWQWMLRRQEELRRKKMGYRFGLNKRNGFARTLTARYYKDGSEILIEQKGKNPRRLTPRECARLMGFNDNFKITVSDSRAYKK